MYRLISSGEVQNVLRLADNSYIPFDPDNTDYQEYLEWIAEGNTPAPAPAETVDPWQAIREKRDALIRQSDWTMTPGATVDQAQWTAYRQVLRDLPQTYENAEDVVWPTVPSTSGPNTIEE
tara:strand:+ start:155 stop:517 length:363 start_codon:yes stop_codon:yes gene_type:complete